MLELFDWQQAELDWLKDHDNIFVAWEMSLGKTPFTVKWIHEKIKQHPGEVNTTVIVAPLNTVRSWTREINEEFPEANVFWLRTDGKYLANFKKLEQGVPGFYIIGWELMRTGVLYEESVDVLVADETHKMANYGKSDQSKFIQKIKARFKAALSGTPAANRPEGIFATQNWLWAASHPQLYRSYTKWMDHYWRQLRDGYVIKLIREITPGQIVKDMPAFSRQRVRDHRQDMPPVMPTIRVDVELTARQRRLYDRLDKDAAVWLDENTFLAAAYPLEQDIRLRQIALGDPTMEKDEYGSEHVTFKLNCKSAKIDALVEIVNTSDLVEDSFLVLVHSAKFIPSVVYQLGKKGISARGFSGSTPQDERDWLIDNLGKEYRVLVAGIAAIGEGTDGLQHVCHNMVWMSKHPSAFLNMQATFRLDRPGQQFPINVWDLVALGTLDVKALETLAEIQQNLDAMIDHKDGVEDW